MLRHVLLVWAIGFAISVAAQPLKNTPALDRTGGWVFYNVNNTGHRLLNPMGPGDTNFPVMSFYGGGGTVMPNAGLKEKLTQLRDVFRDAYPKPQGASIVYKLKTPRDLNPLYPRSVLFSIDSHGLENDGNGDLNGMNLAAHQGDTRFTGAPPNYDGLLSVHVNAIDRESEYGLFVKVDKYTDMLKTKKIPNLSGVYMMPPQNDFAQALLKSNLRGVSLPDKKVHPIADKHHVFRFLRYQQLVQGWVERHMIKVVMTHDGKLPYRPLRRGEFLAVLKQYSDVQNEKFPNKNYVIEQEVIAKLSELNANQLNFSATLHPKHVDIMNHLINFAVDDRGRQGINLAKLGEVFIESLADGYTPCRLVSYYKSTKEEQIQTLTVNLYYEVPAPNYPSPQEHPSLDSRSLYTAIATRLDWGRIEHLLTASP